ncbi:MAG: YdiU family protein [Burkholderiaceae bacterium]|nr:YdiU family protein [Burkholderiaceae bacterium]MDO9090834.1 YdiU family protein [Burkholderiaceae bacterium]
MNKPMDASLAVDIGLDWGHDFAQLGPEFYTELRSTPLPAPYWVGRSHAVAQALGLDAKWLQDQTGAEVFAGSLPIAGTRPLASVYSGHQFGVWAGQLGDGRAILLGDVRSARGERLELQFKGSGRTPYSRMGDGQAVLRSSIREFLCSEAMHALGIPTSRALSVVGSDAPVRREQLETAAVVTRVAPSFIRFGHFEHFAAAGREAQLRALADHVIDRHYPQCRDGVQGAGNAYARLLEAVSKRTASMVAQWQAVGFCHGVMNTDNMSILGLTIDYGPFQFLDAYAPGHICNHSDEQGRYAFDRQPNVAYWNLFCLGQALMPLIGDQDLALASLESYKPAFAREFAARMGAKLGLAEVRSADRALIESTLALLSAAGADYSIFWRRLSHAVAAGGAGSGALAAVRELFADGATFDTWAEEHARRLEGQDLTATAQAMLRTNPKFVLRNHLGEQAIGQAKLKDFSGVETLLTLLESPFDEHPGFDEYAGFPPDWASFIEISCSS